MSEPSSSQLSQWRGLVEQTLRGASFERRMVRRLPGGITLPALQTGRPADAEASALIVALSRDGRWEVCAEHDPGAPEVLARVEQDLHRGADSVRMVGRATFGLPSYAEHTADSTKDARATEQTQ